MFPSSFHRHRPGSPSFNPYPFAVMNPPALYTTSTSLYDTVGEDWGSHVCLSPSFYLWLNRLLLMGGTSALVIGFSFAGYNSWKSPRTLGLLISGVCALILAGIWETFQPNPSNALLPSAIFRKLTIVNILIISILHNFAFTAGTYYIPLYYQALHGTSPLVAGMQVLPFSLGAALVTIPTAWFISWRPGHQWIDRTVKICIALGLALSAIGYGACSSLFFSIAHPPPTFPLPPP